MLTLEKDHTETQKDALLDIYRKLRPGEPPTEEAAQTLLNNYYFNPKRYDLAKVGRYKINKKLGLTEAFDQQTLTVDDVVAAIRYIVALHDGREQVEAPAGALDIAGGFFEFLPLEARENPTGAMGSAMRRISPLHMRNVGGSVNTRLVKEVTLPNR